MTDFDAVRWSRVGATDEELAVLEAEHDALPEPERAGMNGYMTSVSDSDLRAILDARREAEPKGFVVGIEEQPLHPTDDSSLAATGDQAAFAAAVDEDEGDKPKTHARR